MSKESRIIGIIGKGRKPRNWENHREKEDLSASSLGIKESKQYWKILNELANSCCSRKELAGFYKIENPNKQNYQELKKLAENYECFFNF